MNYTEKSKPGIGDPYWYEWSVGEQQILNMLNEDNNINYVELQANTGLGLDDVVVTYTFTYYLQLLDSSGNVLAVTVTGGPSDLPDNTIPAYTVYTK